MAFKRIFFAFPLILLFTIVNTNKVLAQVQPLCTGSLGDPVVNITFGAGANPGSPLNAGITNLAYVSTDCPNDSFYTIRNNTINCFNNSWHTLNSDHTGDPNGYMMVINASIQPSDFYVKTVDNLCGNTVYQFAAWILDLDKNLSQIPADVVFTIELADGTILQTYDTKNIKPSLSPTWTQYGFTFKTPSNVNSVVLRMRNSAPGGIGNDLALDDITFSPCGPTLKSVIVGSNPDSTQLCEGTNQYITLNTIASSGYTSLVYQWQQSLDNGTSWQDIPGANTTTFIRTPTPKGKYLYRLSVAESGNSSIASCRVNSNSVIINVSALPVIQFSGNSPLCDGNTLTLTADINNNGPVPGNYVFTYPETNPSFVSKTQQDDNTNNTSKIVQIINAKTASSGAYTLNATNKFGCSASSSVNIVVNAKPLPAFTVSNILCEKTSVILTDQSTGPATITSWFWNFGDNGISSSKNPTHTYDSSNTYSVKLSVLDANGCRSDTLVKSITVHPLPAPDFILPKVCLKDANAQFVDQSSIKDHTESGFQYFWTFGDPSNTATSTIKNPQHKYTSSGNYNVLEKITSADGCVKDTTKPFTVNGSVPKSMFTVNNPSPLCSEDSVAVTNNSSVDFGSIVKVEIYWDNGGSSAKTTDDNPVSGKVYKFNYAPLVTSQTNSFSIRFVAYSGINCVDESIQNITINKTPVISFDSLSPVCENMAPFQLNAARETGGSTGNGLYSGAGVSASNNFNPTAAQKGTHIIRYTYTSNAGCTAFSERPIIVFPQPSVDAGLDKTVLAGATIQLKPTVSGSAVTYLWTPPLYLDNPTIINPSSTPLETITYKLTVTSGDNCTNSDTVQIKVINGLYIPNAFTPNRDGRNDVWRLPYLDEYRNTVVNIYNRYGQVVFHSVGPNISWDGTFKGAPQPADVYVYIVDLKNGKPVIKGTLTLLR